MIFGPSWPRPDTSFKPPYFVASGSFLRYASQQQRLPPTIPATPLPLIRKRKMRAT